MKMIGSKEAGPVQAAIYAGDVENKKKEFTAEML